MTDYERGYLDGVAAASDAVASFFKAQRDRDAKIIGDMVGTQKMMQAAMLILLAPLQDQVRQLRPGEGGNGETT